MIPFPKMESSPTALSPSEAEVIRLSEELKSPSLETQREATAQVRLLTKNSFENRILIGTSGAVVSTLVGLLSSSDPLTQELAVTALHNLSINDNNRSVIAKAGAIEPLVRVLQTDHCSNVSKENSAATLYSLSKIEEIMFQIGNSGAIPPLVELLEKGTPLGKKDAVTALFKLSTSYENKVRIVKTGALNQLIQLLLMMDPTYDKAVMALVANLAATSEGRDAIGQAGGIRVLVDILELGSPKGKESAASALYLLCSNSCEFCNSAIKEDVVPPLMALLRSGTPRAKEKAKKFLEFLRKYRLGNGRRE